MLEKEDLLALATTKMPFGKFKGRVMIDVPVAYLVWFSHKGFPPGQLGELMGLSLEIQSNGLRHLIDPLKPKKEPRVFFSSEEE